MLALNLSLAILPLLEYTHLEAKQTGSSLIETRNQRDVEVRAVGTYGEIDECIGPGMAAVEDNATASQWPLCAVRSIGGGVDVGAWILPLTSRCDEGVTAPCGLVEAEMRCCAAGEGCECDDCGEHCGIVGERYEVEEREFKGDL